MSDLKNVQVLLVDDNRNMRAITTAILSSVGITRVSEASDGAEALDVLRKTAIDLAVVDFSMARLDGVDFTRLIRNSPDSPNRFLPIIMMTGHSERSRVYEARDAGVTEFVTKPVTAKALLSRVQAVIMNPRPFVQADNVLVPDRRRARSPDYAGPFRRLTDGVLDDA